jgi:Zn finger protein HypA/HybF involved in hydrogenase expression
MGEVSIAVALVEAVEEETAQLGVVRIRSLLVRIGASAAVDQRALRLLFELASEGTILEGATLEFELVEGTEVQLRAIDVVD